MVQQNGHKDECYEAINEAAHTSFSIAKTKCMEAADCHGIASQSDVCGGQYRVSHGKNATIKYSADLASYNPSAYSLDRSCLGGMLAGF